MTSLRCAMAMQARIDANDFIIRVIRVIREQDLWPSDGEGDERPTPRAFGSRGRTSNTQTPNGSQLLTLHTEDHPVGRRRNQARDHE